MTQKREKGFWRLEDPLVLASMSRARQTLLREAGIPFIIQPANIDEREIERDLNSKSADQIAQTLAQAKALYVSKNFKDRLVLGADQVASCEGRIFGKAENITKARELLLSLSGRRHRLHSALCLAQNDTIIFQTLAYADLHVRQITSDFIDTYIEEMGDKILSSAGGYQIEALGAQLFSSIEGDHWTIMGLPILPLLDALRNEGALIS
jgi:septum formation protein